jgi:hypothetical protein
MPAQICPNIPVGFVEPGGTVVAESSERTFECPFISDTLHNATDVVSVTVDFYGAEDDYSAACPNLENQGLDSPDSFTGINVVPCRQSWTGSAAYCFEAPEWWTPVVSNFTDKMGPPTTIGQVAFAVPGFSYMSPAGSPYDYYYTELTVDACLSITLYGLRYDGTVDYEYND